MKRTLDDDFFALADLFKTLGPINRMNNQTQIKSYKPLNKASEYTLQLKIQMKEVKKPPMWRLVEVPAHYNFLKLHYVIQIIMGFNDTHLWQFNKHAYDPTLCIGMSSEDPSITNNADTTPLTKFLQEPGDKLEYIYDFGDDWIFTIELKEIRHTKIKHPSVLKYKEDLNPIDDIGGVYRYLELRNLVAAGYENPETKEFFNNFFMIESEEEYLEFINVATFDLDIANTELSNIADYTRKDQF